MSVQVPSGIGKFAVDFPRRCKTIASSSSVLSNVAVISLTTASGTDISWAMTAVNAVDGFGRRGGNRTGG